MISSHSLEPNREFDRPAGSLDTPTEHRSRPTPPAASNLGKFGSLSFGEVLSAANWTGSPDWVPPHTGSTSHHPFVVEIAGAERLHDFLRLTNWTNGANAERLPLRGGESAADKRYTIQSIMSEFVWD